MSPQEGDESASLRPTLDTAASRQRYQTERDRRTRVDGNAQYVKIAGALGHYIEDPWADPTFSRAPIAEEVEVVVLGGGFGGLLCGTRLRGAGIHDFRIIEKAGDFGGTWYWNRYPGAACDTEAYIYLPLLEELGYLPPEKYARGPDILEHARRIGRHFDLYRSAIFQTQVTEMRWDDDLARWLVRTNRDDAIKA